MATTLHQIPLAVSLCLLAGTVSAAESISDGWFPWPMVEPRDGSALDVSWLGREPAGAAGRITVADGRFIAPDGQRIRWWGTNISDDQAFPTAEAADAIARRLAKSGINIVRLHHLDCPWGVWSGGTLWKLEQKDRQIPDPGQLDKLHRLVQALKANGIYINLNLKVSKTLGPDDGFPESVKEFPDFQKRVDFVDRRMIDLQKDYARRLLTAVNPYTKMSLLDDPAVAVVEINNENSLLGYFTRDLGKNLERWPEPFRGDLVKRWNAWLVNRYGTDAAIGSAWKSAAAGDRSLVQPATPWRIELHDQSKGTLEAPAATDGRDGASDARFAITAPGDLNWHIQGTLSDIRLVEGETYHVAFTARADRARKLVVSFNKQDADWHSMGLNQELDLGTEAKTYRVTFTARQVDGLGRLCLFLGQTPGSVEITGLRFAPGSPGAGLQAGQSAKAGTVPMPAEYTAAQWNDWISFLAETERAYADEMRSYLRDELKVKSAITCSQVDFGGIVGMWREQGSDFIDNHAYWQQPAFPRQAFDLKDFTIPNIPQMPALGDRSFGELGKLALTRVAGKPYTVSEYDHPAPGDFLCEMNPVIATFAALQDWDGIYSFAINEYGTKDQDGAIRGFFDQHHHPAKWGLTQFSAAVFRAGLVHPLTADRTLQVAAPVWAEAHHADLLWQKRIDGPLGFLSARLAVSDQPLEPGTPSRVTGKDLRIFLPPEVVLDKAAQGPVWRVMAPQAAAAVGYLGGAAVEAGALAVTCPRFGRDFAAVTAVALDQKPIASSQRVLVSVVARAGNSGEEWNATRTFNNGVWGHGPTVAERVPATISLAADGPRSVHILAPDGARLKTLAGTVADGRLSFTVGSEDRTLHYEITGP